MTQAQRNDMLLARIRAYTTENVRSPAAAREALIREGFFLPNGEVAPRFAPEPKGVVTA